MSEEGKSRPKLFTAVFWGDVIEKLIAIKERQENVGLSSWVLIYTLSFAFFVYLISIFVTDSNKQDFRFFLTVISSFCILNITFVVMLLKLAGKDDNKSV